MRVSARAKAGTRDEQLALLHAGWASGVSTNLRLRPMRSRVRSRRDVERGMRTDLQAIRRIQRP